MVPTLVQKYRTNVFFSSDFYDDLCRKNVNNKIYD
jgi:hypothetical protein